jgi:hypothetical protein
MIKVIMGLECKWDTVTVEGSTRRGAEMERSWGRGEEDQNVLHINVWR